MGDASTVAILANVHRLLYSLNPTYQLYISGIILTFTLVIMAPAFIFLARRNQYTRSVIYSGWIPLLVAIILCKPAGLVMEISMEQWPVISTFFPLIDGVGAQVAGIQTSRISTFLHTTAEHKTTTKQNSDDVKQTKWFFSPIHVFFHKKFIQN